MNRLRFPVAFESKNGSGRVVEILAVLWLLHRAATPLVLPAMARFSACMRTLPANERELGGRTMPYDRSQKTNERSWALLKQLRRWRYVTSKKFALAASTRRSVHLDGYNRCPPDRQQELGGSDDGCSSELSLPRPVHPATWVIRQVSSDYLLASQPAVTIWANPFPVW